MKWMKDRSRERIVNALLQDLRIHLLTFRSNRDPDRSPGEYRSIYVTIYQDDSFQAVLTHHSELTSHFSLSFPFIYDRARLPDAGRKQTLEGLLDSLVKFVGKLGPAKLQYPDSLSPRRVAKLTETMENLHKKAALAADLSYTEVLKGVLPPVCHICRSCKSGSRLLTCSKHYACTADYNAGNCNICSYFPANPSLPLPSPIASPPSIAMLSLPANPKAAAQCRICKRDPRYTEIVQIANCGCMCFDCWKAYISTYVFIPERVRCPCDNCGVNVESRNLMRKLRLEVRTCSKCGEQTEYIKAFKCPQHCQCCFSCEFTLQGDSQSCPICKGQKTAGLACCQDSGSVRSMDGCNHKVHIKCWRNSGNRCPVCPPPTNRI